MSCFVFHDRKTACQVSLRECVRAAAQFTWYVMYTHSNVCGSLVTKYLHLLKTLFMHDRSMNSCGFTEVSLIPRPHPLRHGDYWVGFLWLAESAILIVVTTSLWCSAISLASVTLAWCASWLACSELRLVTWHNQENSHQVPFLVRGWGLGTRL